MVGIKGNEENKEYFFSTRNEKNEYLVYASDSFKLSEIDLINLIKICLIEARSKAIGKRILAVYRDSTEHRIKITQQRLELIGIKDDGKTEPTKEKPKIK
jgi:hypothetical protein